MDINEPSPTPTLKSKKVSFTSAEDDTDKQHNHTFCSSDNNIDKTLWRGHDEESSQEKSFDEASDVFPDGGTEAWLVLFGAWLVSFCTFGLINCYGVFQHYYQHQLLSSSSPSNISWIGSIQVAIVFAIASVVGRLFDAGYLRWLLIFGSLWSVFCLFMTSLSRTYWQVLLSQGIGLGVGMGILFTPAIGCVAHWFRRRRGLACGILACGSSIGGLVFPIMLNQLINHNHLEFPSAIRVVAFTISACLVISNVLMKTRLPPRKEGAFIDFSPLREANFRLMTIGSTFFMMGVYFPYFYIEEYAMQQGIDPTLASYSMVMLNGASIVGRVLPNCLSDYIGALNVIIISCIVTCAMIFVFLTVKSVVGLWCFTIVFGFASGTLLSILPNCVASLSPSMQVMGVRIGVVFFCVSFAVLLGTPINGAIITLQAHLHHHQQQQQQHMFWGAAMFSGLSMLVGSLVFIVTRMRVTRQRKTWRV